jgi:hypothetical protein
MNFLRFAAGAAAASCAFAAAPALAQTVGSATFLTHRNCAGVSATTGCPSIFPAHAIASSLYAGGIGVGGSAILDVGGGNLARSEMTLGVFDLPVIRAFTAAPGDTRMNANTFGFQSYVNTTSSALAFSISGNLHIEGSSGSLAGSSLLPGGAAYTGYLGLWDPSILSGLTTPRQLFDNLFYAPCGTAGVLATAFSAGDLTTPGEQTFGLTTSACGGGGTIMLAPGQEILVVAGLQIPVNRGGFVDATKTFTTSLGADLSAEQVELITTGVQSAVARGAAFEEVAVAVPEPSTWATLILGFGVLGGALRRRTRARYRFA